MSTIGQKYMDEQDLNLKYRVNMDVLLQKNFEIKCEGKIGKDIFDIMIELCASFHYSTTPLGYVYKEEKQKNDYIERNIQKYDNDIVKKNTINLQARYPENGNKTIVEFKSCPSELVLYDIFEDFFNQFLSIYREDKKIIDPNTSYNNKENCLTIGSGITGSLKLKTQNLQYYLKEFYLPENNDTFTYTLLDIYEYLEYVHDIRVRIIKLNKNPKIKYYAVIENENKNAKIIEILQVYQSSDEEFNIYRHKTFNPKNLGEDTYNKYLLKTKLVYLNFGNLYKLKDYAKNIINNFIKKLTNDLKLDRSIFEFFHIHVSYNNIYKHICFCIHGKHELNTELDKTKVYNPSTKGTSNFSNIHTTIKYLSYDGISYDKPKSIYLTKNEDLSKDEWDEHNTYVIIDSKGNVSYWKNSLFIGAFPNSLSGVTFFSMNLMSGENGDILVNNEKGVNYFNQSELKVPDFQKPEDNELSEKQPIIVRVKCKYPGCEAVIDPNENEGFCTYCFKLDKLKKENNCSRAAAEYILKEAKYNLDDARKLLSQNPDWCGDDDDDVVDDDDHNFPDIATQDNINAVMGMGISEEQARNALNQRDNNIERAIALIFPNGGKYKKSKKKNIKKRINKSKKKYF